MSKELLTALIDLQKQVHAHLKMDVKKHYSLMIADAQASTAIHNARGTVKPTVLVAIDLAQFDRLGRAP